MKEPENFEAKLWLCTHSVVALRIHYFATGVDTSDTDWELTSDGGKTLRIPRCVAVGIVDLTPDHYTVLREKPQVYDEVMTYKKFKRKHRRELAEYNRLKKMFGS